MSYSAATLENTDLTPVRFQNSEVSIQLKIQGSQEYEKVSFPLKTGIFSRIETHEHILEFNLNHEITHAKTKNGKWRDPSEWLKRSIGNDWIYYSTGGYSGVFEAIGEYYLPNLTYPTNSLLGGKPFKESAIDALVHHWYDIIMALSCCELPVLVSDWLDRVKKNTPETLENRARQLFDITGSRVSVLPPDARHVDYNIIPLNISDGCLYKCRFCKIKNHKPFSPRSKESIYTQLHQLKQWYKNDLINYNALFLGEHDALNTPGDLFLDTIHKADEILGLKHSHIKPRSLFLFGSADAVINKPVDFFQSLDRCGYHTFINIGLESYDAATLDLIGKPLTPEKVEKAFEKIQIINRTCPHVELTCNFIMDDDLPGSHHESMMALIREYTSRTIPKGCIYLSPLKFGAPSRQVLYDFYKIKTKSRFPTFLYIIQRL